MTSFFGSFDIWQVLSSFIFLFAIIDPLGNIPVTLNMQRKGVKINAFKVCIATIVILLAFLFAGVGLSELYPLGREERLFGCGNIYSHSA